MGSGNAKPSPAARERGDQAPSDRTQTYLFGLWTLIDQILNSVLFLFNRAGSAGAALRALSLVLAAAAIPIVLAARLLAVSGPLLVFARSKLMSFRNVPFLTWAGVRGGISVALALAVPDSPARSAILAATYAVVLFSIIVQGSTLGFVAKRTIGAATGANAEPEGG